MNISFRPTDYHSETDCMAIANWKNNSLLRKLWIPLRNEDELPLVTVEQVRTAGLEFSAFTPALDELAVLNGRIVGQITLILDPPHRRSNGPKVAWPSIIIGEDSLRGKGVVRRFYERILLGAQAIGLHISKPVYLNTIKKSVVCWKRLISMRLRA